MPISGPTSYVPFQEEKNLKQKELDQRATESLASMLAQKERQQLQAEAEKSMLAEKTRIEQEKQAKDIATLQNLREQGLGGRSLRVGDISVGEQPITKEDPLKALLFQQRQDEEKRRVQAAQTHRLESAAKRSELANLPSTLSQLQSIESQRVLDPKTGEKVLPNLDWRVKMLPAGLASLLGAPEKDVNLMQNINATTQAYRKGQFGSQFTQQEHKEMNDILGNTKFYKDPKLMNKFLGLIKKDADAKQKSAETALLPEDLPLFRRGLGAEEAPVPQAAPVQPSPADLMKKLQEMEARRAKSGVK